MLRYLTGPVLLTALLAATTATAQSARRPTSSKPKTASQSAARPAPRAAMGTFQLVQRSLKQQVSLTTEALAEIERRRQAATEARWELNEYAYVRILPRNVISAPGFQPVEPFVAATR